MFKGFVSGQWSILPSSFYISVFTFSTRACTENANIIFVNRTSEWIHKWGKSKIVSKFNKELTSQEKERASAEGSELLGGGAGGQHGAGDQWPVCVADALLLVLTWNTPPRKASGVSSNPTTVGFRDLPRPLPAQKLKLLSDHKWNQSRPNIRLEAGWPWPWPWVVVSYLPRLCWTG